MEAKMAQDEEQGAGPIAGRAASVNPAAKQGAEHNGPDKASPGAAEDEAQAKQRKDA
jgi:hypothetical protein